MKPVARASLALFAAALSLIVCTACVTRQTHPLTLIALVFDLQAPTRYCSFDFAVTAKSLITLLMYVPAALLLAVSVVSLFPRASRTSEHLWSWSALFAAIPYIPVLGWVFVAGAGDGEVISFALTPGNILSFVALSAPAWSFGLAGPNAPQAKKPSRFSFWEQAAVVLLITSSALTAAYALKRTEAPQPAAAELCPSCGPDDY